MKIAIKMLAVTLVILLTSSMATAAALVYGREQLKSPAASKVIGTIRLANGSPVPNAVVRAYDKSLGAETMLGEAFTNAGGNYSIQYSPKGPVNLFIRAYNSNGQPLAESNIVANAGANSTVDLTTSSTGSTRPPPLPPTTMNPVGPVTYFAYAAITGEGLMYSQKFQTPQKYSRNIIGVKRMGTGEYSVQLYNPPADVVCMASSQQPSVCETNMIYQESVRVTCLNASRTPHDVTFFAIQCMGP